MLLSHGNVVVLTAGYVIAAASSAAAFNPSSCASCVGRQRMLSTTTELSAASVDEIDRRDFFADTVSLTFASAAAIASTSAAPSAAWAIEDTGSAATYAYRSGGLPSLRPLGLGLLTRYEGYVAAPANSKKKQIFVSFDYPSDWLQLDKLGGGIQYVDQRNGDKLYVLRAPLPEGQSLQSVPKSFFAESIFDPRGDIIRSGTVVEGGKTSKSSMKTSCVAEEGGPPVAADCIPRRRLLVKYDTVTGSGVQTVERRGLVDAYEVDGDVYMLVTSSNAVKFDAKGGSKERDTVEAIVESFKVTL